MSNAVDSSTETPKDSSQNAPSVDALAEGLEKTVLESDTQDTQAASHHECAEPRPLIIYTRKQLVFLSQSPLVKAPEGMPEFKVWFGSVITVLLRPFPLSLRPTLYTQRTQRTGLSIHEKGPGLYLFEWRNAREKVCIVLHAEPSSVLIRVPYYRFRREPEDGGKCSHSLHSATFSTAFLLAKDGSSRPQFRSGLSQPSQMGNFKHQPLRPSDRDRDTERDLRSVRLSHASVSEATDLSIFPSYPTDTTVTRQLVVIG